MEIKPSLTEEEFAELDESLRPAYQQRDDGSYRLASLEGWESPDEIENLKKALKSERDHSKENAKTARQFEDELKDLRSKLGDADPDSLLTARDQIGEVTSKLNQQIATNEMLRAVHDHKGNAELLMPHLEKRVKVRDDGTVRVLADDGTVALHDDGNPVTVDELVASMREDVKRYGSLFYAAGNSGGGTASSEGGKMTPAREAPKTRSTMTAKDKVVFIKEHGEDAFMRLPA